MTRLYDGQRIKFREERLSYIVKASNERYAVCTKPFNPRQTVLYTIVDLVEGVRGTENMVFCLGFERKEECREALARLIAGESEVSHRRRIPLNIEWVREE